MKRTPQKCIVCGSEGVSLTWNSIDILRCQSCGLAWRASFDVTTEYYTELNLEKGEVGNEKAASRLRNAEERLDSLSEFLPPTGICDIGCGDGSFLEVLQKNGYTDSWGIEPSVYAYELAVKKNLDVVQGNISDLPHVKGARAINAITLFHVIEHLSDPVEALDFIKNLLHPGGILVIETPDINAAIQKVTNHKNALVYHEHLFYWTTKSLCSALQQSGFKILSVSHRSFDWKNSSIRTSLLRLGFKKYVTDAPSADVGSEEMRRRTTSNSVRTKGTLWRKAIRICLAHLVHLFRLDDYLLVVAERL